MPSNTWAGRTFRRFRKYRKYVPKTHSSWPRRKRGVGRGTRTRAAFRRFATVRDSKYRTVRPSFQEGGMKPIAYAKLPWFSVMDTSLNRAGVTSAAHALKINSIYQPSTVDTHQPMWHDTWSAAYSSYRVTGCKYSITLDAAVGTDALNSTDATQFVYAAVSNSGGTSINATAATNAEIETFVETAKGRKNVHYGWIDNIQDGKGRRRKTFKGYVNFSKLHADFKDTVNDQSTFGSSPSELVLLTYGIADTAGLGRTDSIRAYVRLLFYVELIHPITIAQN